MQTLQDKITGSCETLLCIIVLALLGVIVAIQWIFLFGLAIGKLLLDILADMFQGESDSQNVVK